MTPTQTEVQKWTEDEFERLVLESKPKVAVFDCDGTLWNMDSGHGFMEWSLEQGLVSRSTNDWIDTRYRGYLANEVTEEQICGEMVQIYAGLRESELVAAAATYVDSYVRPYIFEELFRLVENLRKAGVTLWAVSSTNYWVVTQGLKSFNIPPDHVLAAKVRVTEDTITDELIDVPTGEAKAAALHRVGMSEPCAVFGNSIHDLAMLDLARFPFPVNPSPALIEAAAKRNWGYFRPNAALLHRASVGGE